MYIKENFDEFVDEVDEKLMEYFRSLIGKFVIFEFYYNNNLYFGKFDDVYCVINGHSKNYFVKGFDYNNKVYFESALIKYIKVKGIFDNFESALDEFKMLKNANRNYSRVSDKYNL